MSLHHGVISDRLLFVKISFLNIAYIPQKLRLALYATDSGHIARKMLGSRQTLQHCHLYSRLFSTFSTPLKYPQRKSAPAKSRVDFLGIEQEWQARWDRRGTKIQEERDGANGHCLAPFYASHIHKPTMLGTLQSMLAKKRITGSHNCETSMINEVICLDDNNASLSPS